MSSNGAGAGKARRSSGNPEWETVTSWGPLEITINTMKPEKDPRAIAADAASAQSDGSMRCPLCLEPVAEAPALPAWAPGNHAPLSTVQLGGERWYLHYSPYAYCDEHLIVTSGPHRPMCVDGWHMACLLDFVWQFPDYFLGSNADLPIVGGSLLAHDHFQGGCHAFSLMKVPIVQGFALPGFPGVEAGVVRWPVSVLRLRGVAPQLLLRAAERIRSIWYGWDDAEVGIVSHDPDGTPHNTITPIAYRSGDDYILDLALRCNVTSPEHPLGVFHPHERLHHIKKENIGLIEVMGRAILPGRLERELRAVEEVLNRTVNGKPIEGASADAVLPDGLLLGKVCDLLSSDPLTSPHAQWACEIAARRPLSSDNLSSIICEEVGQTFAQVLEDCGVFKWDAAGRSALVRFLKGFGAVY